MSTALIFNAFLRFKQRLMNTVGCSQISEIKTEAEQKCVSIRFEANEKCSTLLDKSANLRHELLVKHNMIL